MANQIQMHTLADLRKMALMYSHEIDSDDQHWGSLANALLNEGQRQMWNDAGGIQDVYRFSTNLGRQEYPLPFGTLSIERVLYDNSELPVGSIRDLHSADPPTCYPNRYAVYGKPYPQLWLIPGPDDASREVIVFLRRSPKDMVEDDDVPELPVQWHLAPAYWAGFQFAIADNSPSAQGLYAMFQNMSREMGAWFRNASKDAYPIAGTHNTYGSAIW